VAAALLFPLLVLRVAAAAAVVEKVKEEDG